MSDEDEPAPSPSATVVACRASREAKSMREESGCDEDTSSDEADKPKSRMPGKRSQCKDGGGKRSLCEHGRQRYYCKDCGGGGICEHGRRRKPGRCKDCGEQAQAEVAVRAAAEICEQDQLVLQQARAELGSGDR